MTRWNLSSCTPPSRARVVSGSPSTASQFTRLLSWNRMLLMNVIQIKIKKKEKKYLPILSLCLLYLWTNINHVLYWSSKNFMQKHGALESEWDSKRSAMQLLQLFQGFANKVLTAFTAEILIYIRAFNVKYFSTLISDNIRWNIEGLRAVYFWSKSLIL